MKTKYVKVKKALKVSLEKFAKRHLELTWNWMQEKSVVEGFLLIPPPTKKAHLTWFEKLISQRPKNSEHYAVISEKNHIGNCGLKNIDSVQRTAQLFIYLGPEYFGLGLASAAVKKLQRLAQRRKLRKIYLQVRTDNTAAIELYLNNNFKLEGLLRREFLWRGRTVDMYRMAWFSGSK